MLGQLHGSILVERVLEIYYQTHARASPAL